MKISKTARIKTAAVELRHLLNDGQWHPISEIDMLCRRHHTTRQAVIRYVQDHGYATIAINTPNGWARRKVSKAEHIEHNQAHTHKVHASWCFRNARAARGHALASPHNQGLQLAADKCDWDALEAGKKIGMTAVEILPLLVPKA